MFRKHPRLELADVDFDAVEFGDASNVESFGDGAQKRKAIEGSENFPAVSTW